MQVKTMRSIISHIGLEPVGKTKQTLRRIRKKERLNRKKGRR